ncbi:peptidoglycan-associated lipoprotein Pal [Pseudolysobacter antarcticus]|uniref:Peptidoglycan-associated protein n=1 Tax=Pseudolysobacter antarcticus TaxID=2511995 RepID=A0A411HGI8_9GAMM|nr:peptidoglycan-associated lipoprotein Pal [Pseudolysobacter antarcticus]QBB69609.1 peptidoglycan-associated lipoprotein Pal [Pseudolysobacter antarcticus]
MSHPNLNTFFRVALCGALVLSIAACSKKAVKHDDQPANNDNGATTQPTKPHGKYSPGDLNTDSCLLQRVVYFDYDKAEIASDFRAAIACHAEYLREFPGARVTLEGNTDERGTREYNLGLGERRGNAVNSALSSAGASSSQLNVVSYGEERATCKEHAESCWHKNRRVEIVYSSKQ